MSAHDDDTCPHLVRASLLEARNKKLQTEVDHLMIFCNCTLIPNKELQAENARLKAEVERLTERNQFLEQIDSYLQSANLNAEEQRNIELEAQVERLTKAGDELWEFAKLADTNAPKARRKALKDWLAAKDGNPRA